MTQTRIELFIDVFDQTAQRALALSDLTPPQLIKAILQEFHSLEYLSDEPANYYLIRTESGEQLFDDQPLSAQVKQKERLVLLEREATLPAGTHRPARPVYLREMREGKAFKIHWLPAIIGRHSEFQPYDELVAVDLRSYPTGLRVSRRHVKLSDDGEHFYIENMASNPVLLLSPQQAGPIQVGGAPQPIANGDIIRLERSGIELKFIVWNPPAEMPSATLSENPTGSTSGD